MFSKAKVGDKVYDIRFGWGVVRSHKLGQPVVVRLDDIGEIKYTDTGLPVGSTHIVSRMLFWGPPKIEAPPAPKRKVKKHGWINIVKEQGYRSTGQTSIYTDGEYAERCGKTTHGDNYLATIPITWEEEED